MLFDNVFGPTVLEPLSSAVRFVFLACCLQGDFGERTAMHGLLTALSRS